MFKLACAICVLQAFSRTAPDNADLLQMASETVEEKPAKAFAVPPPPKGADATAKDAKAVPEASKKQGKKSNSKAPKKETTKTVQTKKTDNKKSAKTAQTKETDNKKKVADKKLAKSAQSKKQVKGESLIGGASKEIEMQKKLKVQDEHGVPHDVDTGLTGFSNKFHMQDNVDENGNMIRTKDSDAKAAKHHHGRTHGTDGKAPAPYMDWVSDYVDSVGPQPMPYHSSASVDGKSEQRFVNNWRIPAPWEVSHEDVGSEYGRKYPIPPSGIAQVSPGTGRHRTKRGKWHPPKNHPGFSGPW